MYKGLKMAEFVRKSDLARLVGVGRQQIGNLTRPGQALYDAVAPNGKVDLDHPNVIAYLEKKKRVARPIEAKAKTPRQANLEKKEHAVEEKTSYAVEYKTEHGIPRPDIPIVDINGMTLAQITSIFGTDDDFKTYLTARKTLVDIEEKELKNSEKRGELITRKLVQERIIDQFNRAHLLLLKDGAKSIAAGVASKIESGAGIQAAEVYASEIIGSFIRPLKNKIHRGLCDA